MHVGQPAIISTGSTASVIGLVEHVDTTIMSPDEARSRFNLQGGLAQIIVEPSIIVTISLRQAASIQIYAGSLCNAQIQTGSQSVLSSLPGFKQFLKK